MLDGELVFLECGIFIFGFFFDWENFELCVYFGENLFEYFIVGVFDGVEFVEIDYLCGKDGLSEMKIMFEGDGGLKIGDMFIKLLYVLKF